MDGAKAMLVLAVFLMLKSYSNGLPTVQSKCEELVIPMCQGLGYNYTAIPNVLGHGSQHEAARQIHRFYPLVKTGCSPYLHQFLCSVYLPMCKSNDLSFLPCQFLCEKSFKGCSRIMGRFGFTWPTSLNCSQFQDSPGTCKRTEKQPGIDSQSFSPSNQQDGDDDDFTDESGSGDPQVPSPVLPRCESLTILPCTKLYNTTTLPNFFNHTTQYEAGLQLGHLFPLISANCYKYVAEFLCSLYAPKCRPNGFLPPCRSFCEEAKKGCRPLMSKFGFSWPASLNCSKFHNKSEGACIGRPTGSTPNPSSSPVPISVLVLLSSARPAKQSRCKPLTVPMCKRLGYTYTALPNFFNQRTLKEVNASINLWRPLMQTGCSNYLKQFLCTLYAPPCTVIGSFLPPCRSICENAKRECSSLMSGFGISWPSKLNCSLFPYRGRGLHCIDMPSRSRYGGILTSAQGSLTTPNYPDQYPNDAHITWKITLPSPYNMIEISIDDMQLEEDRNCFFDYVLILDKLLNQVGPSLCGAYRQLYVITVRGNEASIVFVSDKNTSKKGFSLSYKGMIS